MPFDLMQNRKLQILKRDVKGLIYKNIYLTLMSIYYILICYNC